MRRATLVLAGTLALGVAAAVAGAPGPPVTGRPDDRAGLGRAASSAAAWIELGFASTLACHGAPGYERDPLERSEGAAGGR